MNSIFDYDKIRQHPAAIAARRGAARKANFKNIVIVPRKAPVTKAEVIEAIKSTFAIKFPGYSLNEAIQRQFGPYSINHLHISSLQSFLTAIK